MKKLKMLVAMLMAVVVLVGANAQTASASVKINKKKIVLVPKKTYKLKVKGTNKKVKWKSSKKSIATVSKDGTVKAKKKGTTIVTGKVNGKKYSCTVKVQNAYTTKQIIGMLEKYLKKKGYTSKYYIDIESDEGNKVRLHAYNLGSDMSFTIGWYTINKKTGKGVDDIFFDKIDFSKYAN